MNNQNRIAVEFAKMTVNGGKTETVVAVPFNNVNRYFPDTASINKIVPEIEKDYKEFLKAVNGGNNSDQITKFFENTQKKAIVGLGFINCLKTDLKISNREAFQMTLNSKYISEIIAFIQDQFRKSKKDDPIKYIESCHQLVDLFGFQDTIKIFKKSGIMMGNSTLQALYKVSIMSPQIKEMIQKRELLLTAAFEIPQIEEEKQIEMAQAMKNKNYSEAKKIAKHFQF
jgi:hypothetical protein